VCFVYVPFVHGVLSTIANVHRNPGEQLDWTSHFFNLIWSPEGRLSALTAPMASDKSIKENHLWAKALLSNIVSKNSRP
jgi:hypothetical protein